MPDRCLSIPSRRCSMPDSKQLHSNPAAARGAMSRERRPLTRRVRNARRVHQAA